MSAGKKQDDSDDSESERGAVEGVRIMSKEEADADIAESPDHVVVMMNPQPEKHVAEKNTGHHKPNRYRLLFERETDAVIEARKRESRLPLAMLPAGSMELDIDDVFPPGSGLGFPKRPPWSFDMSKVGYDDHVLGRH